MRLQPLWALGLPLALAAACGDSDSDTTHKVHADAGLEAGDAFDDGTDAPEDASPDVSDASDAPDDALTDAPDAEAEAGDDAGDDASDAALDPCSVCHGSLANAAPPKDTTGGTSTSLASVGAHQSHLGDKGLYRVVQCSDCHKVPAAVGDPGHIDGLPAELVWGAVPTSDQVTAKYESGKCSVYCHGASLSGGSLTSPSWTTVDGSQASCGSCHGVPPPAPHPVLATLSCSPCHTGFNGIVPTQPSLHLDGKLDVQACGACHAVPPATGAHAIHYGDKSSPPIADYGDTRTVSDYYPSGAPYYAFGCGNCHPLEQSKHANGKVEVELFSSTAPATSLKAKSPSSAAYSAGKCNNVYCHSSGQATPSFVETPAWSGGTLPSPRCAACHGNPPRYPSGGAGSATANTHLVMGDDGWELGHFGGMPGPWHTSYHGALNDSASPITCQTCHFDTVDPANVGPGGFYYLDTTGDYDLGGLLKFSCTKCHTGATGAPAVKGGAVLSAKHVNGVRDVVFDARTVIPSSVTGLPAAPNRPTYPYWVTATPIPLPPGSVTNGMTWSLNLANATYDATTKTCAQVACHLKQSFGTGSPAWDPLTWGVTPVGNATCGACHQY